ncbi:MAG: response regulator [Gemmatimonadetes bacterium]|nr:response regulator transcription factor [Gemmatimonadota bacterium]NIR78452.1 response regulator transcription factor [Gemmatimonadota bacterium]NIT87062.1 response regulator transcription factor [Gemmatimonadota bacterium]NIU30901.1 response regulator transcription factor [Gemmatimonadota bacterium]NIU35664.1 response regulator [Gemmatimonadota bacterium]
MSARILIVEDNQDLAYGLRNNLEIEGYEVEVAADGREGLDRALVWEPDLVVLDLMLPELDGYRVLKALRREGFTTPVLVLTARGEETDKVLGFRLGADDYVTKPFGVLELLARVEALLRRVRMDRSAGNGGDPAPGTIRFGDVVVDPGARTVEKGGEEVSLTPKELDLLLALVEREGAVASRVELMREVWGHRAAVVSRTVDTHVAELRRKLEDEPSSPRHILTVHKSGYRFEG